MDYIAIIRKLARSPYYQNIYNASKEVGTINLFENNTNHSGLQSLFLYWLKVYDLLYSELGQKEWKFLDEEVIENDTRCDAFLYWRGKQREAEIDNHNREQKKNNLNFKSSGNVSLFDIDFKGEK